MEWIKRISLYLVGIFFVGLGAAFSFKSNLGSSPIASIPYTINRVWGIEIGIAMSAFMISLVILQIILLRHDFKAKLLLQFPLGLIFGYFTSLGSYITSLFPPADNMILCFVYLALSMIIIAFGIVIYLPQEVIQLSGDAAIQAISIVSKKEFPLIKVLFDSTLVIISFFVCWIFIGNPFASVGIGTIIAAVLIGTIIDVIVKIYEKISGNHLNLKKM